MATSQTRQAILDAAESLFAANGFASTSLREVTGAAGVNLASVNYHFGSKDALISAVFSRRLKPLNEERLRLLDRAVAAAEDGRPELTEVLDTLILPAIGHVGPTAGASPALTRLLGRVHSSQDDHVRSLVHEQFDTVTRRYLGVLGDVLPDLTRDELVTRFHFMIGAMASSLVEADRLTYLSEGTIDPTETGTMVARLVTFLAAGLSAPPTAIAKQRAGAER